MFDIGWQELFVIGVVAIVVVGPKELPRVLRAVTLGVRKIRGMASEFQSSIDELAREAELHDIRRDLERTADMDIQKELEQTIDPTGEVGKSVREIESSVAGTGEELGDPVIEPPRIDSPRDDASKADAAAPSGTAAAGEQGAPRSGTSG